MSKETSAVPAARFPASIRLDGLSKAFTNGLQALQPVNLDISGGEFVSIVGPSGCGKSTLLRIVAGLEKPSSGICDVNAKVMKAFVFQEAALLPWRTVQANAELLMELEGYAPALRTQRAREAIKVVGLDGFQQAYPQNLSGGMRMRLSLARVLALHPQLLLMDEPLAAVDELTRDVLQEELLRVWALEGFTALFVTHNVYEAVYLSSRVIVMSPRPGRIKQIFDVPFPYPRSLELRSSAEFARLAGDISAALRAH